MRAIAVLSGSAAVVALALVARRSTAAPGSAVGGESFARALVRAARRDLDAGVREDLGKNDGRRIRDYFAGTGISPPANWCAAATSTWIREAAAELGVAPPIAGSNMAKAIGDQLRTAGGTWLDAEEVARRPELVQPGMIAVWDRSQPDKPETAWWGHVGVVVDPVEGGSFTTIEGNSGPAGDRVAIVARSTTDPKLIGIGAAWPAGPAARAASLRRRRTISPPMEVGGG